MDDLVEIDESAADQPIKEVNGKWLVTIAVPGKGTKGNYSSDVLKNTGPVALPAGTKSFFKHAKTEDRDVRDQVGVFEEGAFWNGEEDKLQGWLTPFPRYAQVLREAKKNVEASMHSQGRSDGRGNIKELTFRRDNTVDLVAFAGLEGSGLEYEVVESLFAAAAAEGEDGKEENKMAFEITESMWDKFTSTVTGLDAKFDTLIQETATEKQGVADQAAVDAAVVVAVEEALTALADVDKSIDEANIPVEVKESLKSDAHKGIDISETLSGAIAISEAVRKELTAKPDLKGGRRGNVVVVAESLNESEPKNFKVGRWGVK